ncbi:DUF3817 domain-containing protein [Nonomuraea dietziae]|uniref:Integral membrane protein n=1 Tax=Nonomuraea dietziae TaxID=65515 RepID=A0A7W5UZP8_9ACTN|nr:DUF3817 domain-containing protein [Nonomuraea dietziae]MBB3725000.1 integral membrane protein [Nonomuraea dietziae]
MLRLFRAVAIAEACSWVGLLAGMYVKYIAQAGELGVKIFGPVHGGLFVLYLAAVLLLARQEGWSRATTVLGLACSVPPLATVWFERRQQRRRSHQGEPQTATSVAATGSRR